MDRAFHEHFMRIAIDEALAARDAGEVPAGCVIVRQQAGGEECRPTDDLILARAHNSTESSSNPTAHAEILAIAGAAAKIGDFRLTGTVLYVTKEPCAMCAGAIVLARIPVVVWGMSDPRRGGESNFGILSSEDLIHRAETVPGILEEETRGIVQDFFRARRREGPYRP